MSKKHKYEVEYVYGMYGDRFRVHTTFAVEVSEYERIEGVDSVYPEGRYTVELKIAKLFDRDSVKQAVEEMLQNYIDVRRESF